MKKLVIITSILLLISIFADIPEYIELNNLKVIESIEYDCDSKFLYLKEILPNRDDNGIEYEYKIYKRKKDKILENKTFFLRDTKKFTSTCSDKSIIKTLKIKPKIVKYNEKIKKEL